MRWGRLTAQQFLKHYWQRKPVLLPGAFDDFRDPLTPEELAGLACEEEVESRLIFTEPHSWRLQNGPFTEADFLSLPEQDWTLLVQAVDQWQPAVRALLKAVDFLPSWRVDDVMVSFATANGGVGPHFDQYDVFLIQGQGSRRWRVGQRCSEGDAQHTDSGLKLLSDFHTEAEYHLHSGDVLYVPPGVAHWGISDNDSLSYSIGFRAPSLQEMLFGFSDWQADNSSEDQRYTDPALEPQPAAGEITAKALDRAHRQVVRALQDREQFARWFGAAMTQPRYPELLKPRRKIPVAAERATHFRLHAAARIAWQQDNLKLLVSCNGDTQAWADSKALKALLQQLAIPEACIPASQFTVNQPCRDFRDFLILNGSLSPVKAP